MEVYILLAASLIILGISFESINSALESKVQKKLPYYFFIIPSFALVFFVSAFRGDFMTDYANYRDRFDSLSMYSFTDLFRYDFDIEFGYVLLNGLIHLFTDNSVYLFMITTLIILIGFYYQISKYSVNIWLSILMFVTIGSYYASFNITRQILATAIIFASSKFLYERKFFKFLLVVILTSLFHQSALIMVPFYFILNLKANLRNLFFVTVGTVVLILYFDNILSFVQTFVYTNYTESSYGMTGASFGNAVLPIAFAVFTLLNSKKLDPNNSMHRIWFNATIFYAVFSILSLQIMMVERLSYFFAPYALLLIPFLFSKMKDKYLRVIYMMVLVSSLILYNYIVFSDSVFDPYYFVWDR